VISWQKIFEFLKLNKVLKLTIEAKFSSCRALVIWFLIIVVTVEIHRFPTFIWRHFQTIWDCLATGVPIVIPHKVSWWWAVDRRSMSFYSPNKIFDCVIRADLESESWQIPGGCSCFKNGQLMWWGRWRVRPE